MWSSLNMSSNTKPKLCYLVSSCKKTCVNSTVLTDHLNNHCPLKLDTFQCSLCHHVTSTDCNIMTYHIYSYYTGDKSYHCLDCTGSFSLEDNFKTCCVCHQVKTSV